MLLPTGFRFDFIQACDIIDKLPIREDRDAYNPEEKTWQRHGQSDDRMHALYALFLQIIDESTSALNWYTIERLGYNSDDGRIEEEEHNNCRCCALVFSFLIRDAWPLAAAVDRPKEHADAVNNEWHDSEEYQTNVVQPEDGLRIGEHVHDDAVNREHLGRSFGNALLRVEHVLDDRGPLEVNLRDGGQNLEVVQEYFEEDLIQWFLSLDASQCRSDHESDQEDHYKYQTDENQDVKSGCWAQSALYAGAGVSWCTVRAQDALIAFFTLS